MTERESSAARKSWFIRHRLVKACSMLKNEAIGFIVHLILFILPPASMDTHKQLNSNQIWQQLHNKYLLLLPFYGHYTGKTSISWNPQLRTRGFCWSKVTVHMPLLMASSIYGLERRCYSSPQQCFLHCLHNLNTQYIHNYNIFQHFRHNIFVPTVNQKVTIICLQCFDAVGWAAGRASGL